MKIDFDPGIENGRQAYRLDVEPDDVIELVIDNRMVLVSNISINGIAFEAAGFDTHQLDNCDGILFLGAAPSIEIHLKLKPVRQVEDAYCCTFIMNDDDEIRLSGYLLSRQKARIQGC